MTKLYTFKEHNFTVTGEEQDIKALAKCLRNAEGTLGDLRYQIEYEFDIDSIRSNDIESEDK